MQVWPVVQAAFVQALSSQGTKEPQLLAPPHWAKAGWTCAPLTGAGVAATVAGGEGVSAAVAGGVGGLVAGTAVVVGTGAAVVTTGAALVVAGAAVVVAGAGVAGGGEIGGELAGAVPARQRSVCVRTRQV